MQASVPKPAAQQRVVDILVNRLAASLLAVATTMSAALQIASAQEAPKNFVILTAPKAIPEVTFNDADEHPRKLADFRGKVLLLNIWATWCVPCRKEMPALDRLQATLGGTDFAIVPVSIDRGGLESVRKFYTEVGIHHLATYVDTSGQMLRGVGALGLPTTLLVDRSGQEIGRIVGPAEWDQPDIAEFLKPFILNRVIATDQANRGASQPSHGSTDAPGLLTRGLNWLQALFKK